MSVRIAVNGSRVTLDSPYHPDLPAQAKRLGGRFDGGSRTWTFDSRDEQRVRDLALAIYGSDGNPVDLVTVRMVISSENAHRGYQARWFAGREIVARRSRDEAVRLGEGVVIVEGAFRPSAGSVKNPALFRDDDPAVIVEVRDVPRSLVPNDDPDVQIVQASEPTVVNKLAGFSNDALVAELNRRGYIVTKS